MYPSVDFKALFIAIRLQILSQGNIQNNKQQHTCSLKSFVDCENFQGFLQLDDVGGLREAHLRITGGHSDSRDAIHILQNKG